MNKLDHRQEIIVNYAKQHYPNSDKPLRDLAVAFEASCGLNPGFFSDFQIFLVIAETYEIVKHPSWSRDFWQRVFCIDSLMFNRLESSDYKKFASNMLSQIGILQVRDGDKVLWEYSGPRPEILEAIKQRQSESDDVL